jgi:glycosyltransferase involved in cell wall biosynthesis
MKRISFSPLVSIGLPVRNGEDYISFTLKSLLSQSFKNFELIISDNYSTDNTEKICKKFAKKDSRIRFIKQKKNIGQTENFNTVLKKSKGKYFMWASHDDLYKKIHIENLLEVHKINKQIAVAMAGTIHIDERGKKIGEIIFDDSLFDKKNKNELIKKICLQSKLSYFIFGLWKRSLVIKFLPFRTFKFYDKIFIIKAALKYQFAYNPNLTFYKRKFSIAPGLKYKVSDFNLSKIYSSELHSFLSFFYCIKELFFIKLKRKNTLLKIKVCFYYFCWIINSFFYKLRSYTYSKLK